MSFSWITKQKNRLKIKFRETKELTYQMAMILLLCRWHPCPSSYINTIINMLKLELLFFSVQIQRICMRETLIHRFICVCVDLACSRWMCIIVLKYSKCISEWITIKIWQDKKMEFLWNNRRVSNISYFIYHINAIACSKNSPHQR